MKRRRNLIVIAAVAAGIAGAVAVWVQMRDGRLDVLVAGDGPEVAVLEITEPLAPEPLPPGWRHRTFWTRSAAEFSLAVKDKVPALRVATDDSASMLVRDVDVDLALFPILAWRWLVELPIDSDIDERTREGDDHPARFFLRFLGADDTPRAMEIIWGNRHLGRGDIKMLGDFPHYVANGGRLNVGRWHDERVDLRTLFRRFWGDPAGARLTEIAVFCDSDETGTRSISYFADVRLKRE